MLLGSQQADLIPGSTPSAGKLLFTGSIKRWRMADPGMGLLLGMGL